MSAALGYWCGARGHWEWGLLATALLGAGLLASGTAVLNQWYERKSDALMRRTRRRPLPSGRVRPAAALLYGIALSLLGFLVLWIGANPTAAWLGLFTLLSYLLLYTPLKFHSPWSTTVGAVPGAMPPLIGYAAATGHLTPEAWVLYGILFLWQFPHFLSIAWMYRDDYAQGGIRMLPVVEPDGVRTARHILWTSLALVPVSLAPGLFGTAGPLYLAAALGLGLYYAAAAWRLRSRRTALAARKLLVASVLYLPALYAAAVLDGSLPGIAGAARVMLK
jgi:protoheme IX farnesyltransferase